MNFRQSYAAILAVCALLNACGGGSESDPPTTPPTPQSLCSGISGKTYVTAEGNATVTSAQLVAAAGGNPEYCNVQGSMAPSLHFEIKLPTNWNQRLLAIGGGGFDGAVPQPAGYQLQQNYVTVATDGGHTANGTDESWAYDTEKLNDYAYRSSHKALLAARLIVQQRYSQAASHSYFEGCSNGGREALMQAQRYPDDYDGIVARAPAWNITWLMIAGNKGMQQFFASAATQLSPTKTALLSNAVVAACDTLDNVADGIVSRPDACSFDPASLRCPGADAPTCLTDAQIATVNTIYSIHTLNGGLPYYIGWPPGGESDPGGWVYWRAMMNDGLPGYSTRFLRYLIFKDPNYDPMTFVPDDHLAEILAYSSLLDVKAEDDPNSTQYAAFRAHGGKLILWHGTVDPAISYRSTKLLYEQIVNKVGQATADQFVEFFPAPGVEHCYGGPGPDFVDLLTPVRTWVEGGMPPSQQNLLTVKLNLLNLSITNSRPLCKFPKYPRYNGSGDPNVTTSYTCM